MIDPISDRATFAAFRRARRAGSGSVRVRYLAPEELPTRRGSSSARPLAATRVAYAIGRPVGGAVLRNRVRRRLRAVVAELDRADGTLVPGAYLIAAGAEAAEVPFDTLRGDVRQAVDRALRRSPVETEVVS